MDIGSSMRMEITLKPFRLNFSMKHGMEVARLILNTAIETSLAVGKELEHKLGIGDHFVDFHWKFCIRVCLSLLLQEHGINDIPFS